MKFKKKLLITLTFVAMLIFMLAMTILAQEITVTFYNGSSIDTSVATAGKMEMEAGTPFKLPTKSVQTGYSFNWTTEDGRAWAGGSTITLTEDTSLYQMVAQDVNDADTFKELFKSDKSNKIRLTADITVTSQLSLDWYARPAVLLNGHTLSIKGSMERAISGQRAGPSFYGVGSIIFDTTHGNPIFAYINSHSYRGNESVIFIGRDTKLVAPKAVLVKDTDGATTQGYPYLRIFGVVDCKTLMEIGNANDRRPVVEINEGARVTVRNMLINNSTGGNIMIVNVRGGTIIMENSTYSFFRDQKAQYNISGGNFLFAEETDFANIEKNIDNGYEIIKYTVDGNEYQCVVPVACGTVAGRKHEFVKSTISADCSTFNTEIYTCKNCSHKIEFRYGDRSGHNFEFSEKKDATKTELGWEKHVCSGCQSVEFTYLMYDPSNDSIKVVVVSGSSEATVQATIKDIFTLEKTDDGYAITDVKAFGSYTLSQITKIYVPLGITNVNLKTANSYVKEFIIDDDADITITSIAKLTSLETITIKKAKVTFKENCTANSIKTINATTPGANILFDKNAFASKTNLSKLNMVAGATYSFGENSFKEVSSFKELIFVDNSTVNFVGDASFFNTGAEYIYVGKGITDLAHKPFDNAMSLKLIVLMDVTNISANAICKMPDGAKVFHHALTLSVGNDAFKQSSNLQIFTKAAITNAAAFNGCTNYTIHYGIEHEYTMHTKDATCEVEGGVSYTTSCPCGVNTDGIYKKYVNNVTSSTSYEIVELINMTTPKVAHNLNVLVGIKYENGFARKGVGELKCAWCGVKEIEAVASQAPIFECLGYSAREAGGYAIAVKYEINKKSVEDYEAINNVKLDFGMVVANKTVLGSNTPLNQSGNANKGCAKYSMVSNNYQVYELTIMNIPKANIGSSYVLSAYIYDGKNVYYIQENETVVNPSGVCYEEVYEITNLR